MFSTAHVSPGVAPQRELGDKPREVCQFYCEAVTPGKGSDQVCLQPDFPELAEQVSSAACYQRTGQHQYRQVLGNFRTNCCRLIQTWKSHTNSQPVYLLKNSDFLSTFTGHTTQKKNVQHFRGLKEKEVRKKRKLISSCFF